MSLPKNICIDARFYRKATAGVGRYTRGLIHHLQKVDTTNHYTIILTPEDAKEWPEEANIPNWKVEILDIPIYSLTEQVDLLKYLNHHKFDLVHFTMFNHPIFYRGPFVVTIHDLTMSLFPLKAWWHPKQQAYLHTMNHAARAAKHILVPSRATLRDIKKHIGIRESKMTITLEAVEPHFVPETDKHTLEEIRKKYSLTKPYFFFLSAWRPHKGLPELVEAFKLAKEKGLDAQLLIGGKPDKLHTEVAARISEIQKEIPDILTPGFIADEDIVPLYSGATGFICPSHYEGFGLPPLEALSCGCPVITANNSSLPEVVTDAGLYFKTGDSEDLANKILDLATNKALQSALRTKGLEHAKKFSFDKMAEETLRVYQNILQQVEK